MPEESIASPEVAGTDSRELPDAGAGNSAGPSVTKGSKCSPPLSSPQPRGKEKDLFDLWEYLYTTDTECVNVTFL